MHKYVFTWTFQEHLVTFDAKGTKGGFFILRNHVVIMMEEFFSTPKMIQEKFLTIFKVEIGLLKNLYGPYTPKDKTQFI